MVNLTCVALLVVHGDVADAAAVGDVPRSPRKAQDNIRREEESDGEAGRVPDRLQLLSLLDGKNWKQIQTGCNNTGIMGNVVPRGLACLNSTSQTYPFCLVLKLISKLIL